MSNLLRFLSPLAPDDSGACAVLYELGGITVICDAGGCAGNVCGFDEPRWHEKKSALFSAGLRDMDAILGRDDLLVIKLADIAAEIPAEFTAIVGTPVPAVIATDFAALGRMAERKTGLPCITIPTDGTKYYDAGAEQAYYAIFDRFSAAQYPTKQNKIGVLGATPLDTGLIHAKELVQNMNNADYICFGLDSGLEEIRHASECERNIVIAPSGLKTAELLKKRFGIPYEIAGFVPQEILQQTRTIQNKRVLIVHQQYAANALRKNMDRTNEIHCATWFQFYDKLAHEGDFRIHSEQELREAAQSYDVIIADKMLRRAAGKFTGAWINFPHYAVSGSAGVESLKEV